MDEGDRDAFYARWSDETFLCATFLLYKLFMSQAMDLSDVVFSKERVKTFIPPDEERGRNMVSIEEAWRLRIKRAFVHL